MKKLKKLFHNWLKTQRKNKYMEWAKDFSERTGFPLDGILILGPYHPKLRRF